MMAYPETFESRVHPLLTVLRTIRIWCFLLATTMGWSTIASNSILIPDMYHHIPFLVCTVLSVVMALTLDNTRATIVTTALLVVLISLRGFELLLFADDSLANLQTRLVGAAIWWFAAGTTLCMGLISVAAVTRKRVEELVWKGR